MSFKKDYTKEPITKSIFHLAIPIIIANLLSSAYQLTDGFWVGTLGKDAVAAISLSFPIVFLTISLSMGLAMAGTILVSQYKGQKNQEKVNFVSSQTMMIMFIISIFFMIVGLFVTGPLLKLMNASLEVYPLAYNYLIITFLSLPLLFMYFIFQSLLRGIGNVKLPVILILITVLLNLFLDPLFINGFGIIPAMGVSGAAIATFLTQGLSGIVALIILFIGKQGIKVRLQKIDLSLLRKMLKLGIPTSLEQSTRSISIFLMLFIVGKLGTTIVASYGIGIRVLNLIIIPAMGFSIATSTLIGQNMGAGRIDRVELITKKSLKISIITLFILGVMSYFFSTSLSSFFIKNDIEVLNMASGIVKILAYGYIFMAILQTSNGVFHGSGDTKTPMFISMFSLIGIRIPLAYFLGIVLGFNEVGIAFSIVLANVIGAGISFVYLQKGNWKSNVLIERKIPISEDC